MTLQSSLSKPFVSIFNGYLIILLHSCRLSDKAVIDFQYLASSIKKYEKYSLFINQSG